MGNQLNFLEFLSFSNLSQNPIPLLARYSLRNANRFSMRNC